MRISQPALFSIEYALARLWQSWGVVPDVVLGHSLGAYAAATIAGVLSLPDALTLVLARSRLLDSLPDGAMLAVALPEQDLMPLLTGRASLAAVNGATQCVVAGPADDIAHLHQTLLVSGVDSRPLHISAAAHSVLVDLIAGEFEQQVSAVTLNPPKIAWISDRTGRPVTDEQACDPAYWRAHLRRTVRFAAALESLLTTGERAALEVGPGQTLATLTRRHPACPPGTPVVASLPHAADPTDAGAFALRAVGQLWQSGVDIDWAALHRSESVMRTPLPTYPFQRQRFRFGGEATPATPDPGGRVRTDASADAGNSKPADPQPADPQPEAAQADTTPVDTRAAVRAAFGDVLGMDEVDGHDDFFDLGGDSLVAARLIAMLRHTTGTELTVAKLFRAPTVNRLATLIDKERTR